MAITLAVCYLGRTMLSFPNCGGPNKVLQVTNVRALAELCENIGLDFQIILLTRSPENVLISTIVHRGFGQNFGDQAEMYYYVHSIIFSQLHNMDPRFLSGCIDIEADANESRVLLSPLRQAINLTEARMDKLVGEDRKPHQRSCIDPYDKNLARNFTKQMEKFYKTSILFSHLCRSIPYFHNTKRWKLY